MQCTFCDEFFSDSYELFKHMDTHNVTWVILYEKREERFKIIDCIPDLREERFDNTYIKSCGDVKCG